MAEAITRTRLPRSLDMELVVKNMAGETYVDLQNWLKETHDIDVDISTIGKHIQRYNKERGEMTKAIYATEVAKTAVQDLHCVGEMIDDLEIQYHKLTGKNKFSEANQYAKTLLGYLEFRHSLLGGEEKNTYNIDKAVIIDSLKGKLGIE